MGMDRPPYWFWELDRWNLLVTALLIVVVLLVGLRGCHAPQPSPIVPTLTAPAPTSEKPALTPIPTMPVAGVAPPPSPAAVIPGFTGLTDGATLLVAELRAISGTAAPNTQVRVMEGNRAVAEAVADAAGHWQVDLSALVPGQHTLVVVALDAEGNQVAASPSVSFTVLALEKPTFAQLETPVVVEGLPVDLSGTATPGATVRVFDAGQPVGDAAAGPQGTWQLTLPGLTPGEHTLTVGAVYGAGKVLMGAEPMVITVFPAEARPTLTQPAEGSTIHSSRPLLMGHALPGNVVIIYDGQTLLGEAIAGADGNWVFRPDTPLAVGSHTLAVVAIVGENGQTLRSQPVTFRVEAAALKLGLVAPVLEVPAPGSSVNSVRPQFVGTAAPNSIVRIYDDNDLLGEARVDADGRWTFRPDTPLAPGRHRLTLVPLDAQGKEAEPRTQLELEILAVPAAGAAVQPPLLTSALPSPLPNSRPVLSGEATPGTTVRVYDGDVLLGEVQVDAKGRWRFVPEKPLAAGDHTLRLATVGEGGAEVLAPPIPVTVAAEAVAITPPTIRPLLKNGKLRPGGWLIGSAPPGSQVQVYDGETLLGTTEARADGSWLLWLPWSFPPGYHEFWAMIATKEGVALTTSEIMPFEVMP